MAGGDGAEITALGPVFEAFAARVFHVGDSGKGTIAKLVNNQIFLSASVAVQEGFVLAAKAGLDALLDRLAQGAGGAERSCAAVGTDIGSVARAIAGRFASRHQVSVIEREPCAVLGDCAALEQVLTHLVTNAVEASAFDAPVFIGINAEGSMARVEIIDSGQGMSPQFLTTQLFRPFATSKPGGFGIGAYEAREMVRAIGGRLDVESREGVGTRFVIRLPRAAAAGRVAL